MKEKLYHSVSVLGFLAVQLYILMPLFENRTSFPVLVQVSALTASGIPTCLSTLVSCVSFPRSLVSLAKPIFCQYSRGSPPFFFPLPHIDDLHIWAKSKYTAGH